MDDQSGFIFVCVILLTLAALCIAAGLYSHSLLVGVLCLMGIITALISGGYVQSNKVKSITYLVIGSVFVGAGSYLSHFSGLWVWILLWVFLGVNFIATIMFKKVDKLKDDQEPFKNRIFDDRQRIVQQYAIKNNVNKEQPIEVEKAPETIWEPEETGAPATMIDFQEISVQKTMLDSITPNAGETIIDDNNGSEDESEESTEEKTVFRSANILVDILILKEDKYCLLDVRGNLILLQGKDAVSSLKLPLSDPSGFIRLSDKDIAVAGKQGAAVLVEYLEGKLTVVKEFRVSSTVDGLCSNPYGTMLVLLSTAQSKISCLMTASGIEQVLAVDIQGPTTAAFSTDGRYLGIGCASGDIHIVDMAKRSLYQTFKPAGFPADKVLKLLPSAGGGWLAAYDNGYIAKWTNDGKETSVTLSPKKIAVFVADISGNRVAAGGRRGHILVWSYDLKKLLLDEQVHNSKMVVGIKFTDNGGTVVSACRDGSIRRIQL